jgi:Sec20
MMDDSNEARDSAIPSDRDQLLKSRRRNNPIDLSKSPIESLQRSRMTMSMEIDRLGEISSLLEKDALEMQKSSKEQAAYGTDALEAKQKVEAYRAKEARNKLYVYIAFAVFVSIALYIVGRRLLWMFFRYRI